MLKIKLFIFLSLIKNSFSPCVQDKKQNDFETPPTRYHIEKTGRLPSVVDESSGLVMISDSTFWTINDDGKPELYEVDLRGNLLSTILVPDCSNKDWEEVTMDKKGFVYIGDFGNNSNCRKDLCIYKYDRVRHRTDTILFSYLDQPSFPPTRSCMNYDCEAMFHFNDSLYIVSKNRGDKIVRFYRISDKPGRYAVQPFYTTRISSMITGASIDTDQKRIALLSYGKIYFFNLDPTHPDFVRPCSCMGFAHNAQAEGIAYRKNNSMIVTNEQGKIFRISPRE